MHIDDFLRMLKNVSRKPDAQGNYLCKCPAHDDSTASLHVKLGQNKKGQEIILVKCFAGCTREAILSSMGLRDRDLTVNPTDDRPPWEEPAKKARRQPAPRPKALPPAAKPQASADLPKKQEHGRKTVECAYQYVSEGGQLLYESVRYRFEDGKKTFNQRRPDPEHPGQWLYNMGNVLLVLYRLPDVAAAIAQGKPVWVAEGEKDADSLCKMGLCGTTAPMGAGKWNKPQYAEALRGADVYILPDNDEPGWGHAKDVARSLDGIAKSSRILDLRRIWKDMPKKADVSDLMAIHGVEKTREMLEELSRMQFAEKSDMPGLYARIGGYGVQWNSICKMNADGDYKRLCNFVAVPVSVVTLDDGVNTKSVLDIRGWGPDGKALPTARVDSADFGSMAWVGKQWNIQASIFPGTQVKDQVRFAIAEAGRMTAIRQVEYTHTGWRQIDGKHVYLHGTGALGAENVRSSLEGSLQRYGLNRCKSMDPATGFLMGMGMLDVMTDAIAIPLLALSYLAPLNSMLRKKQAAPSFALFLYGVSGSLKSTAAAMALSHFGDFDGKTPTASFRDTGNSVREKAFYLKDSVLWVDDYHPVEGQQEKRRMDNMAQDLARAFGDHAERGRLNADRTLQVSRPPRSLCIMTGEDLPGIGASGIARFYIVDVKKGDIPITDGLTQLQGAIRAGALQSSMAGFIERLAGQMEKLPDVLAEEYVNLRSEAQKRMKGSAHGRSVEAIAHLMLGWKMMLGWGRHLGVIPEEGMDALVERGWKAMTQESLKHAKEAQEDAPEMRYLQTVSEMLMSKQCYVIDLQPGAPHVSAEKPGMIGWVDKNNYMLLPDSTYQAVAVLFQRQGKTFPLSPRAVHRMMKEKGLVIPEGDSATRHKWINGRSVRLLFVPRYLMDGGEPPAQQTGIFTPVDEPWPGT